MAIKQKVSTKEITIVEDVICNVCGKSCRDKCDMNYEYAYLRANWGFGSNRDLQQDEAHICEDCFISQIMPLFKITSTIPETTSDLWEIDRARHELQKEAEKPKAAVEEEKLETIQV